MHDLVLTNETSNKVLAARLSPWVSGTNVIGSQSLSLTNTWPNYIVPYVSTVEFNEKYKPMFTHCTVLSMWFKYTPGITQGTVGHSSSISNVPGDFKGGGANGLITCMWSNDPGDEIANLPTTDINSLMSFKGNRRSTTFSMYKPFFKRFTPRIKVDIADGALNLSRFVKYSFDMDVDTPSSSPSMLIMMQVPREVGFEYLPTQTVDTYYPVTGNNVIIGSIEIGANVVFSKLRI